MDTSDVPLICFLGAHKERPVFPVVNPTLAGRKFTHQCPACSKHSNVDLEEAYPEVTERLS